MSEPQSLWGKFWCDSKGNISIVEIPNSPIILAAVFLVLSKAITHGRIHTAAGYIYFGFLFTWAWLEITAGKSYFRRILGAVILVAIVYSHSH